MSCETYTNGSAPTVIHTMATLPAGFCPPDWQSVFNQIASSLISQLPGSFSTFVIGSDTPSTNDQDKIWFRLDGNDNCKPMGWFIYWNGSWVRATPHPIHAGVIVPVYDANWDTYIIGTPGYATQLDVDNQIASEIALYDKTTGDGGLPFWRLCNGENGTPNLLARFIRGAGAGASSTLQPTNGDKLPDVFPNTSGGEETNYLSNLQIPLTDISNPSVGALLARGGTYAMTSRATTGHNNIPPYVALYYMMRTTRYV